MDKDTSRPISTVSNHKIKQERGEGDSCSLQSEIGRRLAKIISKNHNSRCEQLEEPLVKYESPVVADKPKSRQTCSDKPSPKQENEDHKCGSSSALLSQKAVTPEADQYEMSFKEDNDSGSSSGQSQQQAVTPEADQYEISFKEDDDSSPGQSQQKAEMPDDQPNSEQSSSEEENENEEEQNVEEEKTNPSSNQCVAPPQWPVVAANGEKCIVNGRPMIRDTNSDHLHDLCRYIVQLQHLSEPKQTEYYFKYPVFSNIYNKFVEKLVSKIGMNYTLELGLWDVYNLYLNRCFMLDVLNCCQNRKINNDSYTHDFRAVNDFMIQNNILQSDYIKNAYTELNRSHPLAYLFSQHLRVRPYVQHLAKHHVPTYQYILQHKIGDYSAKYRLQRRAAIHRRGKGRTPEADFCPFSSIAIITEEAAIIERLVIPNRMVYLKLCNALRKNTEVDMTTNVDEPITYDGGLKIILYQLIRDGKLFRQPDGELIVVSQGTSNPNPALTSTKFTKKMKPKATAQKLCPIPRKIAPAVARVKQTRVKAKKKVTADVAIAQVPSTGAGVVPIVLNQAGGGFTFLQMPAVVPSSNPVVANTSVLPSLNMLQSPQLCPPVTPVVLKATHGPVTIQPSRNLHIEEPPVKKPLLHTAFKKARTTVPSKAASSKQQFTNKVTNNVSQITQQQRMESLTAGAGFDNLLNPITDVVVVYTPVQCTPDIDTLHQFNIKQEALSDEEVTHSEVNEDEKPSISVHNSILQPEFVDTGSSVFIKQENVVDESEQDFTTNINIKEEPVDSPS